MNKKEIKEKYYKETPNCYTCQFSDTRNLLIGLHFHEMNWCDLKNCNIGKFPKLKARFCKQYCPKEEQDEISINKVD